ncbi:ECF RNA polymerase sigma-E factor [Arthrobacter ulcerisalmonis]|uniref:ECF RNA polymerase sigma-E factor n=1 Tax=Arthrobacter ulcerisalmonis TaxID=2483813 RepID=A0A3P5WHM9_9MICC|nr:sigma-70 family RNA polymerase sigma factor [Arthrobacter ulcerisalmonis]VDC20945.1 ECF RNA polymerase sigma-E factor [Arthrobacter ulcerisalmonis]
MTGPLVQNRLDDVPDALLVGRATNGDTAAFEALARRYGPLMRACARRLTGSYADADDVVQEVLVQAWKQLDTLREPGAVKSWLLRLTGSRSIDAMRRRRHESSFGDIDEVSGAGDIASRAATPEASAVQRSSIESLKAALARLPEEQRRCWVLKEFNGQSYEQIAETLNISPASVRGRLARARVALVREMEEWR